MAAEEAREEKRAFIESLMGALEALVAERTAGLQAALDVVPEGFAVFDEGVGLGEQRSALLAA